MDAASAATSETAHEVKIDVPAGPEAHGYDRLASFMGFLPEVAIFHRFAALNAKNILYLQAELLSLERQLTIAAEDDARSTSPRRQAYSRQWFSMSHSDGQPDGNPRQWRTFMKIRRALDEYNTAILQQREIVKMEPPGRLALSLLRQWMESPKMGTVYLTGHDSDLWRCTPPHELLALDRRGHDDLLSAWLTKFVRGWLDPTLGRFFKVGIHGTRVN